MSTCNWELLSSETGIKKNWEDIIMSLQPAIWSCWAQWKNCFLPERAMLMGKSRDIRMGAIRLHKPKNKSLSCKSNSKTSSLNCKSPVSKIKSSLSTFKRTKSRLMPKKPFVRPNKDSVTFKETKPTNSEQTASPILTVSYHCSTKPLLLWIKSLKMIWHN